jgi:hypothetical protein
MSRSPAAHLGLAKLDSVSIGAIHHVHITHPAHPP